MKAVLLSFIIAGSLMAAQISHTFKLRQENGISTQSHSSLQKAIVHGNYDLQIELNDDSRVVMETTLEVDSEDKIEPGKIKTDSYSNFSKPVALGTTAYLELRELFYEKEFDDTLYKIGKMQSVWGKADGIKLIDKLNPQSYSEFILPSFEESRIPLWSISSVTSFEDSEFEIIWIPDTTYNKIPTSNATYAFTSSRIVPQAPTGATVIHEETDKPNHVIKDSDIALKYLMMFENMEMGLYYFYYYEDNPVLYNSYNKSSNTVTLKPEYKRSQFYGFSMDYSYNDFVYRLETGYTQDKHILNSNSYNGIINSDEFAYILGVDWYGLEQSLISIQFNQSYLLKKYVGYTRPEVDNTMTFLYKKEMMNDTLHAEILAIHNFNDGDGLIRPKLNYELSEESLVYIGVDQFYGDEDGLYGQHKDQSRFILGIEITF